MFWTHLCDPTFSITFECSEHVGTVYEFVSFNGTLAPGTVDVSPGVSGAWFFTRVNTAPLKFAQGSSAVLVCGVLPDFVSDASLWIFRVDSPLCLGRIQETSKHGKKIGLKKWESQGPP